MGAINLDMETSNYKGIPAMNPPEVHQYLNELGRGWTGQGVAMEVGCWLGATSVALLEGLVEAGYDRPFWAFDRWSANGAEVIKASDQKVPLLMGQDLKPVYEKNVSPTYAKLKMVKGAIPGTFRVYTRDSIEFCLFDAPKCNPVFRDATKFVVPYFIPGVTVFGLMDYYFYKRKQEQQHADWKKFLVPVHFIKKYSDHFTLLREFSGFGMSAFFRYEKEISWE